MDRIEPEESEPESRRVSGVLILTFVDGGASVGRHSDARTDIFVNLCTVRCHDLIMSVVLGPFTSSRSIALPHSVVDFVINLHQIHQIPLSLAYSSGVSQFRSLRASHEVALQAAQTEMQAHGHEWPTEFSAIDRLSRAEDRNLLEVLKNSESGTSDNAAALSGQASSSATTATATSGPIAKGGSLLAPTPARQREWTQGTAYLQGKLDNPSKR